MNRHGCWKPETSRYYYCRFTICRRSFRGSTEKTTLAEAIVYAKAWKAREKAKLAEAGRVGGASGPLLDLTLLAAANRYLLETPAKRPQDEARMDLLIDSIGSKTMLSAIDDAMLMEACSKRARKFVRDNPMLGTVKRTTINTDLIEPLSKLLWRARNTWKVWLPVMPDFKRHRVPAVARTRELSLSEEITLMRHAGDYADVLAFALASGLRRAEIPISWNQVIWEEDVIRITVKGGKTHEVLITPAIRRILERNLGRHPEKVFTVRMARPSHGEGLRPQIEGEELRPVTSRSLYHAFKAIARNGGLKNLVLHDLRRTAGARRYRATGDIALVSKYLGHSNIEITRRHYVHIQLDDLKVRLIAAERLYEEKMLEVMQRLAA